ncbi:helix-turn-helix domain-containing protein [Rhodococcus erythropolis]
MPASDADLTAAYLRVRGMRRRALGAVIRAAREKSGLSQVELAAVTGISRHTLSRLENGAGDLIMSRFWDLAIALGTTPADLMAQAQAEPGTLDNPPRTRADQ